MYLAPVRPPNQRLPNRVYATRRVVAAVAVVAMLFLLYVGPGARALDRRMFAAR